MKLLLFSDLHCDADAARRIVEMSIEVDMVIGAGDFATCRHGIERTLDVLKSIRLPAVVVPGNSESVEELRQACRDWSTAHVLHGNGVQIKGVEFFGLGGGIPVTPFGSWSYDFTEEQATELLVDCPTGGIVVSHSPPRGAVDVSSRGTNLGSVSLRQVIEDKQPRLVVCGHIHESAGQRAEIGPTTVINAGPKGIAWEWR